MARAGFKSVDDYIAAQPRATRPVLQRVRETIRKALPRADEVISYQIAAYRQHGGVVIYFAGFKDHYSIYPAGPGLAAFVAKELVPYEYNAKGKVCRSVDPVGRETRYTYGNNNVADAVCTSGSGIDLLKVEQKNGASWDVVRSATYDSQHQMLTATDAALRTTTYTYLPDGRAQTVVSPARNGHDGNALTVAERTTAVEYYPDTDPVAPSRLKKVTGPSVGATPGPTSVTTYDALGRVRTMTDSNDYTITMDYDALDRQTKVTYPDNTYEQTTYNRLDAEGHRDRMGRWNHTFHDALRRVSATRDPAGRTMAQHWCTCGSLDRIVDPAGNAIVWDRDLQGRVAKEIRPDGKFWEYVYEGTTSRLKTLKDPKQQVKTYSYDLDDRLIGVAYTGQAIATNDVAFKYRDAQNQPDPYGRLLGIVDGTGTTAHTYHPAGVLGATRLKSVDGPLSNDLLEYVYDEVGSPTTRKVDGVSQATYGLDSLGRVRTQTTPVGSFTFSYEGTTGRPLSLVYPNNQRTDYAYYGNSGDHRLQDTHNKLPNGTTLSRFGLTYDAVGTVDTWSQQHGVNPAETYGLDYDRVDQLRTASLANTSGTILANYGYAYDNAGNRTVDALGSAVTTTTYDNRNWITGQVAGGSLSVAGLLNEPGTVAVNSAPVPVDATNRFAGQTQVGTGSQTLTVVATDASGNARTNSYQVQVTGSAGGPFVYDDNGNLKTQGSRTFDWDAENRLVAVKDSGATVATFVYDGLGRRFQKTSGGVTRTFLYDGTQLVQERLSSGGTIKYFDGSGIDQHLASQDQAGVVSYYAADHLGSVSEITGNAGNVIVARRYDLYGNPLSGGTVSGYAYTGREWDSETSLYYYRSRYYDPRVGRFLSEDPIGFSDGLNLFAYVYGNPAGLTDPFGTMATPPPSPTPAPTPSPSPSGPPSWPGQCAAQAPSKKPMGILNWLTRPLFPPKDPAARDRRILENNDPCPQKSTFFNVFPCNANYPGNAQIRNEWEMWFNSTCKGSGGAPQVMQFAAPLQASPVYVGYCCKCGDCKVPK